MPASFRHALASLCLLVASLPLLVPAAQAQAPLTLEEIVTLRSVAEVRLSPADRHIAYLLNVPRKLYVDDDGPAFRELHVVDFQGNSKPYVTGDVTITALAWSADGGSLLFVAQRDPDAKVNSLWRIPLNGGEAEELFTHEASIGSIYPSPDGRRLAFTASTEPAGVRDELVKKGFKAVVYEESAVPTGVWMLDLEDLTASRHDLPGHASDFAWDTNGEFYAVALAPTPLIDDSFTARDIYVVDAASGEVRNSIGSIGKLGMFAPSPDGERIAYIGSEDMHDPSAGRLYIASLGGGERRDLLPGYAGHVADFVWSDDVTIRWLGDRGLYTEWKSVSLTGARGPGKAPTGGPVLSSVHGHPDHDVVAAIGEAPNHPREVFLLRDDRPPRQLTNSNPWLADRRLARQEALRHAARDGLELDAVLIHPLERVDGGNPLVIFVHGGPEAHQSNGWMSSYAQPGQALAAQGYLVAYPNYRGSTGRGVEFSKLGQHALAEAEFDDLVDLKRHLVDAGLADGERTGISGGSYGGYASMWAATALTGEFAAAVAFVGLANQISVFGTGDIPWEMHNVHTRAWPWDDWQWMLERSPIYHAGKSKTPLLIMGGDADPRVHPSQSLEMYRNMKLQTDTPVRLVIYPGEQHGNRNTAAQYDYALRLKRWMDHYLIGPGGEMPPYELPHAERLETAED